MSMKEYISVMNETFHHRSSKSGQDKEMVFSVTGRKAFFLTQAIDVCITNQGILPVCTITYNEGAWRTIKGSDVIARPSGWRHPSQMSVFSPT